MIRDVITLPLRIGVSATRFGLHVAGQAVTVGWRATERLIEVAMPGPAEPAGAPDGYDASGRVRVDIVVAPPPSVQGRPSTPPAAPPHRTADEAPASAPSPSTPPAQPAAPKVEIPPATPPAHVSEEPHLVESFADPGAEDGAGAAVHVEEPWKGYRHMTAREVIARLVDASREELAAVALYERAHRGRKTVLAAATRQLREASR